MSTSPIREMCLPLPVSLQRVQVANTSDKYIPVFSETATTPLMPAETDLLELTRVRDVYRSTFNHCTADELFSSQSSTLSNDSNTTDTLSLSASALPAAPVKGTRGAQLTVRTDSAILSTQSDVWMDDFVNFSPDRPTYQNLGIVDLPFQPLRRNRRECNSASLPGQTSLTVRSEQLATNLDVVMSSPEREVSTKAFNTERFPTPNKRMQVVRPLNLALRPKPTKRTGDSKKVIVKSMMKGTRRNGVCLGAPPPQILEEDNEENDEIDNGPK